MVFSSVIFLFLFLPGVLAVGLPLQAWAQRPSSPRWGISLANAWLLFASVVFYAWGEPILLWVLLASCLLNYLGGRWCAPHRRTRAVGLVGVVTANLLLLAGFKYGPLAADIAHCFHGHLFGLDRKWSAVILPLGISFYTFHGISYVVDVWREKVPPSRNLLDFLCYSTLFPQLVAGPIVRYSEVSHFLTTRRVTGEDLAEGSRRFIVGLGKKALIANRVSVLADAVFGLPAATLTTGAAWLGLLAYTLQIYYDFSGYSDMAIGLGRMFGFRFPENFDYPYAARSMREFWRRWHMTLSRFFRDYLYIPLGGNRAGSLRTGLNLVIVFGLCGLWHGASWIFVVWGLFHGFFLASERLLDSSALPSRLRPLGHLYVIVAVMLGWVLFRSESWSQSSGFFRTLAFGNLNAGLSVIPWDALTPDVLVPLAAGACFCFPILPALRERCSQRTLIGPLFGVTTAAAELIVLFFCLILIGAGSHNPFIYFRF